MCMVSNIGDGWKNKFPEQWPMFPKGVPAPEWFKAPYSPGPTQDDFDALRKELEELKKVLKAAKKFDEATGQHHCEMEDKVKFIKEIAKALGVDLGDVFDQK